MRTLQIKKPRNCGTKTNAARLAAAPRFAAAPRPSTEKAKVDCGGSGERLFSGACTLHLVTELHRRHRFRLTSPSMCRRQAPAEGRGLKNVTVALRQMKAENEEDGAGGAGAAVDG